MSIVLAKKNACMYLIAKAEPKSKRSQPVLRGMVPDTLGQGTAKGAVRTCGTKLGAVIPNLSNV